VINEFQSDLIIHRVFTHPRWLEHRRISTELIEDADPGMWDQRSHEDHLSWLPDLGEHGKEYATCRMGNASDIGRFEFTLAKLSDEHVGMPSGALVDFVYAERGGDHIVAARYEIFRQ